MDKTSQGFTLVEILVIILVMGILSAIAIPSFVAFLDKVRLNSAVAQVRGALQEAQRQAIRRSEPCIVTLNTVDRKVTGPCLITGDRTLPDRIAMVTNISENPSGTGSPTQVTFGILGTAEFTVTSSVALANPPSDPSGKIVLSLPNGFTTEKKCVAISNTLGLTRVGTYSTESGICTAS